MWMTREKVPAEYCPAIEGETRRIAAERADASLVVTCEELRPDVAWSVLHRLRSTWRQSLALSGGSASICL
jgi:DNA-binding transcriptional regulator YdaS (Cro superfamily)